MTGQQEKIIKGLRKVSVRPGSSDGDIFITLGDSLLRLRVTPQGQILYASIVESNRFNVVTKQRQPIECQLDMQRHHKSKEQIRASSLPSLKQEGQQTEDRRLNQKGYNQTQIAKMPHIDPSTVSKYINRSEALKDRKGIDAAVKEFGIEDQFAENQNVVAELKKSDLTVADVKVALQVENILQDCGIPHDQYKDFIQVLKNSERSGYIDAAKRLNNLEKKTGMSYEQIVGEADKACLQLKQSQQELESVNSKVVASKKKLAEIHQEEEQATQNLKEYMQQIGVDEQRLKLIEPLGFALKKAKITDQMLPAYIERQELLNKAGISIDVFADIMGECKVATMGDNGKHLLNLLEECGSLNELNHKQQAKKELLEQKVSDLETQPQLSKAEAETQELKVDTGGLKAGTAERIKQHESAMARYEKQKRELAKHWQSQK